MKSFAIWKPTALLHCKCFTKYKNYVANRMGLSLYLFNKATENKRNRQRRRQWFELCCVVLCCIHRFVDALRKSFRAVQLISIQNPWETEKEWESNTVNVCYFISFYCCSRQYMQLFKSSLKLAKFTEKTNIVCFWQISDLTEKSVWFDQIRKLCRIMKVIFTEGHL